MPNDGKLAIHTSGACLPKQLIFLGYKGEILEKKCIFHLQMLPTNYQSIWQPDYKNNKAFTMTNSEILIYQNQDGNIKIDVRLEEETVWLTQAQLCELFQKSKATISEHIKNVFEEGELDPIATVRKFRTVQMEGSRNVERELEYYNLDVIISVGYRVKSIQGTQFRIWATQRLKEYIIKGFALNDDRFKTGNSMNYFHSCIRGIPHLKNISHANLNIVPATTTKKNARINLLPFASARWVPA
jgi:hypothetical protein